MRLTTNNLIAVIAFAALAGCAETSGPVANTPSGNASKTNTPGQAAASRPSTAVAAAPVSAPQAPAARAVIAADGTVAEFGPEETELSKDALAVIASLTDSATHARSIQIVGYCDKKDAGKSAKKIAISRAAAVKSELVKLGVSAKKIHTKYVTNVARHAVLVTLK